MPMPRDLFEEVIIILTGLVAHLACGAHTHADSAFGGRQHSTAQSLCACSDTAQFALLCGPCNQLPETLRLEGTTV